MHEQIARNTRSVIAVAAPAEKALRVPLRFRRQALEPVPIAGGRAGVRRNRVFPGAHRRIAVVPRLHQIEFAQRPASEQVLRLLVNDGADALASDLQYASAAL